MCVSAIRSGALSAIRIYAIEESLQRLRVGRLHGRMGGTLRPLRKARQKSKSDPIAARPDDLRIHRNRSLGIGSRSTRSLQRHRDHGAWVPALFCQQVQSTQTCIEYAVRHRLCAIPVVGHQRERRVPLCLSAILAKKAISNHRSLASRHSSAVQINPFPFFVRCRPQPLLHLLGNADQKLVPYLGLRRINSVGGQFQHTFRVRSQRRNAKGRKMLHQMNHSMLLIQINQVERNQHSQRVNPARRDNPYSLVGPDA